MPLTNFETRKHAKSTTVNTGNNGTALLACTQHDGELLAIFFNCNGDSLAIVVQFFHNVLVTRFRHGLQVLESHGLALEELVIDTSHHSVLGICCRGLPIKKGENEQQRVQRGKKKKEKEGNLTDAGVKLSLLTSVT